MESHQSLHGFNIVPEVSELYDELVLLRRQMHKHPEVLFDLPQTRLLVLSYLEKANIETINTVGRSGIVGIIRNPGPCVLLRADMDALDITETNEVDYKSLEADKMHACGHDGHVAMLLVAAKVLSKMDLKGTVKFVFQPAEEGGHGAREMITDKYNPVLESPPVDKVFGLHITNTISLGDFIASPKYASCNSEYFFIEIVGRGGHASTPYLTIDPISAGAHLVLGLQTILSRNIDPKVQAVVSVTMINSGEVPNAIPDTCKISGTIRSFEPEVKALIRKRIQELCLGTQNGFGCQVNLEFVEYYPPIENDPQCVETSERSFKKIHPHARRETVPPMIGEDFAYFTQKKPGCFIMLGCATQEKNSSLHSSSFDFDERAMLVGASYWVQLVKDLLSAT